MGVYEELTARGMIAQMSHQEEIKELLNGKPMTFYIGFDPTADSLHIGHFVVLKVMKHLQLAGHKPIALLGGGTALVGDPTDKTGMRKVMSFEEVDNNAKSFAVQIGKYIDFTPGNGLIVNNAEWLTKLNYVEFLRDIGFHFSVNRMLAAECYKARLDTGLTFTELNYMLMQAYDYLHLHTQHDCILQIGGNDQWSNIIAGMELIRKAKSKQVFCMTFALLLTADGKKMGKTEKGAVWLDKDKLPVYDFYQYWRNVDDKSVINTLKMLTFMPLDEIEKLSKLEGSEINEAKKILAFEVTKLIHGEEEALKAKATAEQAFEGGTFGDDLPTFNITAEQAAAGMPILDLLLSASIIPSKSEGRRLLTQNGITVNGEKAGLDTILTAANFTDGDCIIRKGKKLYYKIKLS